MARAGGNTCPAWVFIFAVVGIQLFGRTRYGATTNEQINFGDFPTAMLVLFRVALGNFIAIKQDLMVQPPQCHYSDNAEENDCGMPPGVTNIYFSSFLISVPHLRLR